MMAKPTSNEEILAMVRAELDSNRRWLQRIALVAASIVLAIVLALWATEPKPMLLRLHVSFAIMSGLAVGWIVLLTNILVRKNCPTAWDRIATAWMSVVGCSTFAIASMVTAWLRGDAMAMLVLATTSGGFLLLAIFHLRHVYCWRDNLKQRLSELGG